MKILLYGLAGIGVFTILVLLVVAVLTWLDNLEERKLERYERYIQNLLLELEKGFKNKYPFLAYFIERLYDGLFDTDTAYPDHIIQDVDQYFLKERGKDGHSGDVNIVPRNAVLRFARAMEEKLRRDDHTKDGWQDLEIWDLMEMLRGEVRELNDAYTNGGVLEEIAGEAVDVANFAMMIYDNAMRRAVKTAK